MNGTAPHLHAPPLAQPDESFWRDRHVLVTGHTGFKGSWLALWLTRMGANVSGFSLDPPTVPSHFGLLQLKDLLNHDLRGDIRDADAVQNLIQQLRPQTVFHLAAQPVVSTGYDQPAETFDVNVMGTTHLLEAIRTSQIPCSVVVITSDKCYQPPAAADGYREEDPLGGHDPYSASKAATEIVCEAYRHSYFSREGPSGIRLATVRAGNVIGGGDWARDRLIPDTVRSLTQGIPIAVRNPDYVRPWQHVLEPLGGYLLLAEKLACDRQKHWDSGWNFGPYASDTVSVRQMIEWFLSAWGAGSWVDVSANRTMFEVSSLRLSIEKVLGSLGWAPRWSAEEAVKRAAHWYSRSLMHSDPQAVRDLSLREIDAWLQAGI